MQHERDPSDEQPQTAIPDQGLTSCRAGDDQPDVGRHVCEGSAWASDALQVEGPGIINGVDVQAQQPAALLP